MSFSTHTDSAAMWIDDIPLSSFETVTLIRQQAALPRLVQEWVLDKTVGHIQIDADKQQTLLDDYRNSNQLTSDESYADHLQKRHIDENLLRKILIRPYQVVRYREERWGPVAQSLYLQHKDSFDLVKYHRLQSGNADVMQEIYFLVKDGEESWDSLARQFPGAPSDATALQGPIPVAEVEAPVLEALRQSEPGRVSRPVHVGSNIILVALEEFQPSSFGDEVRKALLKKTFDEWMTQECSRMLNKSRFPE